jgi:transposase
VVSAGWASRSQKGLHASERDEAARATWWRETSDPDPARCGFGDESGANLRLTPRVGRAPRGQRVVGVAPRNHGPNVTLFAAMSSTGITAAMTMTGAADRERWPRFVRQILLPSLRLGQIVLRDNLGVHKNAAVRHLIEAAGRQVRVLPPYSPDFHPIEQAFSKRKTALRHAGPRSRPALEDAIAAGLATITPRDARAWFRHRGYDLPEQLL